MGAIYNIYGRTIKAHWKFGINLVEYNLVDKINKFLKVLNFYYTVLGIIFTFCIISFTWSNSTSSEQSCDDITRLWSLLLNSDNRIQFNGYFLNLQFKYQSSQAILMLQTEITNCLKIHMFSFLTTNSSSITIRTR